MTNLTLGYSIKQISLRLITISILCLTFLIVHSCADDRIVHTSEREPTAISIQIEDSLLIVGEEIQLSHSVEDQSGEPFDELPPWLEPVYHVDDESILRLLEDNITGMKPGKANIFVTVGDLTGSAKVWVNPGEIQADIHSAYIVQNVQNSENSVPLIAGRKALLRVFVTADQTNFFKPPSIRAHISSNGKPAEEFIVEPHQFILSSHSIPTSFDESDITYSWNAELPGHMINPGLRVKLELDPDKNLPLKTESARWFPSSGRELQLNVSEAAPFKLRFVPVKQPGAEAGNVNSSNADEFFDFSKRIFPFADVQLDVRATYTSSVNADTREGWSQILNELRVLRIADNSPYYYHGIIKRLGGPAGVGYVNHPIALSHDNLPRAAKTIAHELGHNFGLSHVNCGGPSSFDQHFPNPDGHIGDFGFDFASGQVISPTSPDIMGYCRSEWISDYHIRKVLQFRETELNNASKINANYQESVLVWGRINGDGILVEPSFSMPANAVLPEEPGNYTLELLDSSGAGLYSTTFTPEKIADGPEEDMHFAFAIPANLYNSNRLANIRVSGGGLSAVRSASISPEMRQNLKNTDAPIADIGLHKQRHDEIVIQWDADDFPMIIVRDPQNGQILSFARNGEAAVKTEEGSIELLVSDGVQSFSRTLHTNKR